MIHVYFLLTFGVNKLTKRGATIPGIVETVFAIPNISPAYLQRNIEECAHV